MGCSLLKIMGRMVPFVMYLKEMCIIFIDDFNRVKGGMYFCFMDLVQDE